jgi:hypothetical protein
MTEPAAGRRAPSIQQILIFLAMLAVLAAILTPETRRQGGGLSSYSTAPEGASIAFELAERMGWNVTRRETPLDSTATSVSVSVQVVIAPQQALGRREVHHLLENVRRGGALVFSLSGNSEIADSLGVAIRTRGRLLLDVDDASCERGSRSRALAAVPPTVHSIVWRRPSPGPVTPLTRASARDASPVAVGFPLGKGRVAVIGSDEVFTNEALRTCQWGADLLVARAWEYVRSSADPRPMTFDEFHHGRGMHEGSVGAIATYLSRTASGRFFATLLAAGVLLLFALSPRPIIPREPERIVRRSPLEHADALGRAYADVRATRTATARLVAGLRRRTGRGLGVDRNADDRAFLEAVTRRFPALTAQTALLSRGLREQLTPREFALSADALLEIERVVATPPTVKA